MSDETYGQNQLVAIVQSITAEEAIKQLNEKVVKLEKEIASFHTCLTCAKHKLSGGTCSGALEKTRIVCEYWEQGAPKTALNALEAFKNAIDIGWADEVSRLRELASYGQAPYRTWAKVLPKGRAICNYCQHHKEKCANGNQWHDACVLTCISFQPLPLPAPEYWQK